MLGGDHVLQAIRRAHQRREHDDHGETRIHGTNDEVRRKQRPMPTGQLCGGEVQTHGTVHRDHERRRDCGKQGKRRAPPLPCGRRSGPADREHAVEKALPALRRECARGREIREQAEIPEEQRDRDVGGDRGHVPRERALEVRPHAHRGRIRYQPIREPRPAEVQEREHRGVHEGDERHRFRDPAHPRAPPLVQQKQERGDERAGVPDADPPHEVHDRERPCHGNVVAPHADTDRDAVRHARKQQERGRRGETEQQPPAKAGGPERREDPSRKVGEVGEVVAHGPGTRAGGRSSSSGFGFRTRARYRTRGSVPSSPNAA